MLTLRNPLAPPRFDLAGRVVFLTGGANGIGAATATRLVEKGALVAIVDRDLEAAQALAQQLGAGVEAFAADVTDIASVEKAVAAVVRRFGGIDVTIANAGILGPVNTVATVAPADFEKVLEVNLLGVWRTVRATLPHVRARNGYVLTIASAAAALPTPTAAAYGTSKAAVEAFSRALRLELTGTGTSVGIAYFGLIDTELTRAESVTTGKGLVDYVPSFMKAAPASRAADVIVRGIETRTTSVYTPWWVPGLLTGRILLEPLLSVLPQVADLVREADHPASVTTLGKRRSS